MESSLTPRSDRMLRRHSRQRMQRFAAKLLFQYRVTSQGQSNRRRLCERRIIMITALRPEAAFAKAESAGQQGEHQYRNSDGNDVHIEFIGVLELIHLGLECALDE